MFQKSSLEQEYSLRMLISNITFCRPRLENALSLERTDSPSISITHQSEFELLDVAEIRQSQQTGEAAACFPTAGTCSMSRAHR